MSKKRKVTTGIRVRDGAKRLAAAGGWRARIAAALGPVRELGARLDGERTVDISVPANDGGSGRLDALAAHEVGRGWRRTARILMALLAVAVIWASFARLDEVALASGEVIPQGNVKVIQHFEGGIIQKIHIADGDVVRAGDRLVDLILGTQVQNAGELRVRLDGLILKRSRLAAQATGSEPVFPDDVAKRQPKLLVGERKALEALRREQASGLTALRELVVQQELAIKELQAKRDALAADLELARKSLAMSKDLLAEGLTAKMEHLQHQREVRALEGAVATIEPAIPRRHAALAEARARLEEARLKNQREAYDELGQVDLIIARTRELLAKADEQQGRTQITSPIAGVVKNLRHHTIGGVVRAGEPIMEIVPIEGKLVIEAKLSPIDRGYVRVGHRALVKISSYEFIRYGGLEGKVTHVAADSSTSSDGQPYFRIVVETDKAYLGDKNDRLPITPGMQAMVNVHTGTRSVMNYLLRPVLKLRHEAFRER